MKRIFKLIGSMFSVMIVGCYLKATAVEVKQVALVYGVPYAGSSSVGMISDSIEKKEDVLVKSFEFLGNLGKSDYKYIKVLRDITFSDSSSKNMIAKANTEANFRYNALTRESECLSCSYNSSSESGSLYTVSSFSRPANKNTELGSGLSTFKLKHLGIPICKDSKEINCDYTGNIEVRAVELNS